MAIYEDDFESDEIITEDDYIYEEYWDELEEEAEKGVSGVKKSKKSSSYYDDDDDEDYS